MLTIIVPKTETFNAETSKFAVDEPSVVLELEHSLVALSKWEEKFKKPFLTKDPKTPEEILGYIEAMIVTAEYPKNIVYRMTRENLDEINSYIESSQSATTFKDVPKPKGPGETVTSELIYYWMVAFSIPPAYENWHINRLFNLIRIANIKHSNQSGTQKMTPTDRRKLNEERKRQYNTSG
jgi:hypothetical protein